MQSRARWTSILRARMYVAGRQRFLDGRPSQITSWKFSADGEVLWSVAIPVEDAEGWHWSSPSDIGIDSTGAAYVTGALVRQGPPHEIRPALIKIGADGTVGWIRYQDDPFDMLGAAALAVSVEDVAHTVGTVRRSETGEDIAVSAYGSGGELLWRSFYDAGLRSSDRAAALAVDEDGNVFVTGGVEKPLLAGRHVDRDIVTLKYDESGELIWDALFDGRDWSVECGYTSIDDPRRIVLDSLGDVIVVGNSNRRSGRIRYVDCRTRPWESFITIKYDREKGKETWNRFFNCGFHQRAHDVAIDSDDDIYVTGSGQLLFGGDIPGGCVAATVRYTGDTGVELWAKVNPSDPVVSRQIYVDDRGRVYVSGSYGAFEGLFAAQYTPVPETFLRGDCNGDGEVSGSVADALFLLRYNFLGGDPPPCLAACDADSNRSVLGSVVDAVYLLQFAFLGGPPPGAPFPDCGESEPTVRALGCRALSASCQ